MVDAPFQQPGLDFIGEIHPPLSGQQKWILTRIEFFTKWVEAISTWNFANKVIIKFLEEGILEKFGCRHNILIDNDENFKSTPMVHFCE